MSTLRSLYYLSTEAGINVYNAQNTLIGTTTTYKAIAHNGKCIGSIQVDTGDEQVWISGHGIRTQDGIKWSKFGSEGRKYFLTRGVMFTSIAG
jgi:hypothetical protein